VELFFLIVWTYHTGFGIVLDNFAWQLLGAVKDDANRQMEWLSKIASFPEISSVSFLIRERKCQCKLLKLFLWKQQSADVVLLLAVEMSIQFSVDLPDGNVPLLTPASWFLVFGIGFTCLVWKNMCCLSYVGLADHKSGNVANLMMGISLCTWFLWGGFSQHFGLLLEQLGQHLGLLLEQLGQQHLGCFIRTAGQRHLDCF
jgi:hypothetical protein